MRFDFTAVLQKVPEGYIGYVAELSGADTSHRTAVGSHDRAEVS